MVTLQLESTIGKLNTILQGFLKNIKDLKPVWEIFAKYYRDKIVDDAFETRGKLFGKRWAAYSKKYLKWKQKKHPGKQMLVLTGAMRQAAKGGAGSITNISNNSMEIGIDKNSIPYAGAHQKGYKNIPQRPYFLMYNNSDIPIRAKTTLREIILTYISSGKEEIKRFNGAG